MGRTEKSQLDFCSGQFEIQGGQCGQRLAPQGPGEIGRARVGVGGVEGREHGSAPLARKEKDGEAWATTPRRHGDNGPVSPVREGGAERPRGCAGCCRENHERRFRTAFLPNFVRFTSLRGPLSSTVQPPACARARVGEHGARRNKSSAGAGRMRIPRAAQLPRVSCLRRTRPRRTTTRLRTTSRLRTSAPRPSRRPSRPTNRRTNRRTSSRRPTRPTSWWWWRRCCPRSPRRATARAAPRAP
ncbi:hypothetical protein STXM2123_3987 [Streptomyces sp. F-3]|nr:hypothetical protein STXM2123_3987 [Streptomyces sp. F-3]